MTTYTTNLGLALPIDGDLAGTWGQTVNDAITTLLDSAVAGTTTLSTDADVTLTDTTGAANQARQAIIRWTAGGTVTRNITAPARTKSYIVINATTGSQSIVFRGAGPTSGVTVVAGERCLVVWNGTDFVKAGTNDITQMSNAPAGGLVGVTATQTLTNKTLTDPTIIGTVLEDVFTITDAAAFEIDPANGSIQLITLGASRTPKATNFLAGEAVTLMVDDGSAFTITWTDATFGAGGVVWKTNAGTAPTLNTTGFTVITLWKVGTQVYGARVGDA